MVQRDTDLTRRTLDSAPAYEIDQGGHVYNKKTQNPLKAQFSRGGYKILRLQCLKAVFSIQGDHVALHIATVQTEFVIAALVLSTFGRQPLASEEVTYIDGDKVNTDFSNLRWSTPKERELLLHVMPEARQNDWCTIPWFPRYAVDRFGRVFNKSTGKEMTSRLTASGYHDVKLISTTAQSWMRGVHSLMLWAWVGMPPSSSHTPDHINRNRADNTIENLRWADPKEQCANRKAYAPRCRRKVVRINDDGTRTPFATVIVAANESGCSEKCVGAAIRHGYKTRSGFMFEYDAESEILNEEWMDVAGARISSEGRIQFKNGRVTHGFKQAGYYVTGLGGKPQLVHRLVATVFVENSDPENFNIVHHINHNKLDNRAENLQWINTRGNILAAVEFGAIRTVPVFQFDLKTGALIQRYTSVKRAHEATGANAAKIRDCVRGLRKSSGGCLWGLTADAPSCAPEAFASKARPVFQFDMGTGSFIKEHKSAKEASKDTGGDDSAIRANCAGKTKSAGCFVWSYTMACPTLPTLKVVFQFELHTGKFIEKYDSAFEAEEKTGITAHAIRYCARGDTKSSGSFAWSYTRGGQ